MSSILIVEDEERIASFVDKGLRSSGFATAVAGDGESGLAMATSGRFDLVVLDLGLPDIDGYAVVNALRRDERLRALPMVVYTGRDLDETDRRRLRLGETRFVTKAGESPEHFERQVIGLLRTITSHAPA
jgi:CheY-like chemotaxis protein